MFSEKVCKEIGQYVYRLIDPRNGETFYVGRGANNRVFEHARNSEKLEFDSENGEDTITTKLDRIRAIKNCGLEVQHIIHRHKIPKEAVGEVEAALIDAYAGLTNIVSGVGSSARGTMHHLEIQQKFDLPVILNKPIHSLLLINVNHFENEVRTKSLYDQVRFAWRISKKNAEQVDYILAVVRGVVKGVFVANEWKLATKTNFPDIFESYGLDVSDTGRYGFVGREAPQEIKELYFGNLGKQLPKELSHNQNPIKYYTP